MDDMKKQLGLRIRQARMKQGLSQLELSDMAQVSPSHLSDIERGKKDFGIDIFIRLVNALQVSADWLLELNTPTVSLDIGTWEGTPQSLSANMLKGLARLIVVYNDELKDDTFKEKLGIISCKEITQEAKVRKAGSMGFTETFLNYYNKKTRFGQERAKLYKKQKGIGKEEGSAAADDAVAETEPSSLSGKENPGGETAPRQMDLFDLPGST